MSKNYYWSLALLPTSAAVCLWTREDSETSILAFSKTISVEKSDFVSSVDAALGSLASDVPDEGGEPEKTVFGVLNSWVSEGHIKKEYLANIREICGELTLSPVGFVVFPEAVAHWIKQNEGGPLSAVVIAITDEELEVTLFKIGTPQGTITVGRSASVLEDVVEALTRFGVTDPLPSRFLIFGGEEEALATVSSDLTNGDWKEIAEGKLTFLHDPKIEIVNAKDVLIAVSIAGSSEMGPVSKLVIPDVDEEEVSEVHANVSETEITPNELGFVMDADIAKVKKSHHEEIEDAESVESYEEGVVHGASTSGVFRLKNKLSNLPSMFKREKEQLPVEKGAPVHTFHHAKRTYKFKPALFGVIGVAILLGLIFAWFYFPKADVTIFISPRTLTASDVFTLKSDITEPDVASKVLPAKVLSKTVSGQDSASATGTKTVGEKAKGSITIRNGTSNDIKLPSGALLVGPNNLQFSIDESASVSAALSPSEPGTKTLAATAVLIGSDYNIVKDTSLKVGNFSKSEIDAVVSTDFAGGSSRQINAVSKADLDGLLRSLLQKLTDQSKEELSTEVTEGDSFVPDSVSVTESGRTFDRKVGDEADTINLSLSVNATGVSVPKDALGKLSTSLLSSQVPGGFTFRPEQTETSFTIQKGVNGLAANVSLNAHLLPDVSPDKVSASIKGKTMTRAQEYLSTIPGFVRASITISPSFPGPFKVLPWITKHVTVSIEAEK